MLVMQQPISYGTAHQGDSIRPGGGQQLGPEDRRNTRQVQRSGRGKRWGQLHNGRSPAKTQQIHLGHGQKGLELSQCPDSLERSGGTLGTEHWELR